MVYHIQYHGTKTSMNKSKTLSVVIPVKNEEENLPFLFDELIKLEKSIFENGLICEFIFLDNNSTDNSYKLISDIKDLNSEIISVKYTKDIGYEKSIMNGLKISSGDVLIILDSDLQDPPSLIIDFINHWKDGSMIVAGLRENSDENFLIKNLRRIFYFLVEKFSFSKIPANIGAFILFDKKVKDLVIQNNSDNLYIRGDILTSGFDVRSIVYTRKKRKKGKSNFNLLKLIKFSTDKIFLTSNIPSLFPISISIFSFLISIGIITYLLINKLINPSTPQGFTFLALLITFSITLTSFIQTLNLKYMSLIYKELTKYQNYGIQETSHPELINDRLNL